MTTAIVGYAAVAFGGEEEHLAFEVVGVQRPAMRESDNLSCWVAPILIVDGGLIFGSDERHLVEYGLILWSLIGLMFASEIE